MILSGARKKAAEEAKARKAAGLTVTVRDAEHFKETVVEREVSAQSERSYSPSEGASSSSPKLDTVPRVMDKVPDIGKWGPGSEAAIEDPGYAQTELGRMSHHTKQQPLQELLYPQYPVFCPNCTALPSEPWYLEATGVATEVNNVEQHVADRLKTLRQQLERMQQSKT
jgi:hypothetical protein